MARGGPRLQSQTEAIASRGGRPPRPASHPTARSADSRGGRRGHGVRVRPVKPSAVTAGAAPVVAAAAPPPPPLPWGPHTPPRSAAAPPKKLYNNIKGSTADRQRLDRRQPRASRSPRLGGCGRPASWPAGVCTAQAARGLHAVGFHHDPRRIVAGTARGGASRAGKRTCGGRGGTRRTTRRADKEPLTTRGRGWQLRNGDGFTVRAAGGGGGGACEGPFGLVPREGRCRQSRWGGGRWGVGSD